MIGTRNGARRTEAPAKAFRGSVRNLASDVVTLAELQTELLKVDLRTWAGGLVVPMVLLSAAAVLALAAIPLLLVSLAYCLTRYTEVPMAASLLISAGAGFLVAGMLAWVALRSLRRGSGMLTRFNSELKKNMNWLKEVLTSSDDSTKVDHPIEY